MNWGAAAGETDRAPGLSSRWRALAGADRRALGGLVVWSGLVIAGIAALASYQAGTLAYPVGRILFEDQFRSLGDGHIIPHGGELATPALAALFMAPVCWLHAMAYATRSRLFPSRGCWCATPWRPPPSSCGPSSVASRGDRGCVRLASSPPPSAMLVDGHLHDPRGGDGFSAVILGFLDFVHSAGRERRTNRRILIATAGALAVVHFGVLVLWNLSHPQSHELHVGTQVFANILGYPVSPFRLGSWWAQPVEMLEMALYMAGSCIFLLVHPLAWGPAVVDLLYYATTPGGVRDHTMVLSTIGLFPILGVRAGLFTGGSAWRNRALVGGALFATFYGHALAGRDGLVALALAPGPPRPRLADVVASVPPGAKRCVVLPSLYAGFDGPGEHVATYSPADLKELRIDDPATIVFVAPTRLVNDDQKGGSYEGDSNEVILAALAARIRSGHLHASACPPLVRPGRRARFETERPLRHRSSGTTVVVSRWRRSETRLGGFRRRVGQVVMPSAAAAESRRRGI